MVCFESDFGLSELVFDIAIRGFLKSKSCPQKSVNLIEPNSKPKASEQIMAFICSFLS